MSETRLTNAIIPEVFTAYTAEESIYKSRLFRSRVISLNAGMSALLAGGGETYNLPGWQDVGGSSGDIPSETVATTVNNMAAVKQVFLKQTREKAWGTNDLVKVFAGSDPLQALQNMVVDYWAQALEIMTIKSAVGVFLNNVADNSSDLINDISGLAGAAAVFSSDGVIDAQALLGENGTVGRPDLNEGDFVAIGVHPAVYALMRKQDLIDFIAVSEQAVPVPFFMGMEVIVTRNAPTAAGVYDTYIFKNGAFQFGQTTQGYVPTETHRVPGTGYGIDQLFTRRTNAIHPIGTKWLDGSVAGISPTDAELAAEANWERSAPKENMRMVLLKHKIA